MQVEIKKKRKKIQNCFRRELLFASDSELPPYNINLLLNLKSDTKRNTLGQKPVKINISAFCLLSFQLFPFWYFQVESFSL